MRDFNGLYDLLVATLPPSWSTSDSSVASGTRLVRHEVRVFHILCQELVRYFATTSRDRGFILCLNIPSCSLPLLSFKESNQSWQFTQPSVSRVMGDSAAQSNKEITAIFTDVLTTLQYNTHAHSAHGAHYVTWSSNYASWIRWRAITAKSRSQLC